MTFGMKTWNGSTIVTIDDNTRAMVYMGKAAIPDQYAHPTVDISCKGVPTVYFGIPVGRSDRAGVAVTGIKAVGTDLWRVSLTVYNPSGAALGLYLRWFGLLNLNYPNGSAEGWGVRAWDGSSRLIFDSGLKMHRLAGNTYATELVLLPSVPDRNEAKNAYDTSAVLPFSLTNKSIRANARGTVRFPEYVGTYTDFDHTVVDQYNKKTYETVYAGSGSTLNVMRVVTDEIMFETAIPLLIDMSKYQTVYSRLAVIDNAVFP